MNKELRRIFTTQLYFLDEFNSIVKRDESDEAVNQTADEYNETVVYLSKQSNQPPKLYSLIGELILNLILLIIYYYCVVSDLYLCYCYLINLETINLVLTCLWFFLPSFILICGEIKAFYSKYFKQQKKLKFVYKSLLACLIYSLKLNIFYARVKVLINSYWKYLQFRDLHLLRKFFDFMNNGELYSLNQIEINSIQKIYLTNFKLKLNKIDRFKSELEYTFAVETIFSSIPQAFLQISIFYSGLYMYDKKQLFVQSLRILLCCYGVGEGAASYIQYFSSFLFGIELSDWFYVYRIVTNIMFFSSRLLSITVAFIYYKIPVCVVVCLHFVVLFLISFLTNFNKKNSKFTKLFLSFYNVCFRMLAYFEDFDLNKVYLLHYLISCIENVLMAYSYKYVLNTNCFFPNFVFYYAILSFLLSFLTELFIVKRFFIQIDSDSKYDSLLNRSFKNNIIKFDSLFAS